MATSTGEKKNKPATFSLGFFTRALAGAALVSIFPAQSVQAQAWTFDPFVELVATYTDNLFLEPDGAETSDYVGQINPGLVIDKSEGRFTADVYYRMQSLFFSEDSDLNTIYHQLAATATAEAVQERFYIDLTATIDQSVVDPTQPIPISNIVATDNLGDVTVANVNPYFIQRLGTSGVFLRADYVKGIGRYDDFGLGTFSRVDDFEQDFYGVYFGTNASETGLEWSLTYDKQEVDYELITDYVYEQAGVGFAVPLSHAFRFIGLGGVESDIVQARDIGGLDSDYWEAGFRINAGQNKSLELRRGERFFGNTWFGNLLFDGRVLSLSVTYSRDPTTSALDNLGIAPGSFSVADAEPLFDDLPPTDDGRTIAPRAEVYISTRLTGRVEIRGNRGVFSATYTDEERDFIDTLENLDDAQDSQVNLIARYLHEIGARTDLVLTGNWIRYDFLGTDVKTDVRLFVISLLRRLGDDVDLRVSFRLSEQESDSVSGFGDYTENAIEFALVKRF